MKSVVGEQLRFTVGIAARNEGHNIYSCLKSIADSAECFYYKPEIIVCINQTTDNTVQEIKKFQFSKYYTGKIRILNAVNLIEAQRAIWERASYKPVVFIDADTFIDVGASARRSYPYAK